MSGGADGFCAAVLFEKLLVKLLLALSVFVLFPVVMLASPPVWVWPILCGTLVFMGMLGFATVKTDTQKLE